MSDTRPSVKPQQSFWLLLANVIHRYATWFVAPFVALAALTALLYIATPQIERWYYREVLQVQVLVQPKPLSAQIAVAQRKLSLQAEIFAVRPAPMANSTTRVMFRDPRFPNTTQAVFVDPYRLKVLGQYPVYGTSGLLPLRTKLDHWHRDLGLGDWGRWYSELAATWLGLLALSGVLRLVFWRRSLKPSSGTDSSLMSSHVLQPKRLKQGVLTRNRRYHAALGLLLLPMLLFFAITGLTWSPYAGQNILQLRQMLQWQTPSLNTHITRTDAQTATPYSEHDPHSAQAVGFMHITPQAFEQALSLARGNGIDAAQVQVKAPSAPNQAWVVQEIGQRWPTQVDSVAIDLNRSQVVDQLRFEQYPMVAKLIRWGIDAHIGALFGWFNQLLLLCFAMALLWAIICGYRIAYLKQQHQPRFKPFFEVLAQLWQQGTVLQRLALLVLLLALSLALPLLGLSLLLVLGVALAQYVWQSLGYGKA